MGTATRHRDHGVQRPHAAHLQHHVGGLEHEGEVELGQDARLQHRLQPVLVVRPFLAIVEDPDRPCSGEPRAMLEQRQHRSHARLHVAGAAPVDAAVADLQGLRIGAFHGVGVPHQGHHREAGGIRDLRHADDGVADPARCRRPRERLAAGLDAVGDLPLIRSLAGNGAELQGEAGQLVAEIALLHRHTCTLKVRNTSLREVFLSVDSLRCPITRAQGT